MSLMKPKRAEDVTIPRLCDDPRYAKAADLLARFTERGLLLEQEQRRLQLAAHFAPRARENDGPSDAALRVQFAELPPLAVASPAGPATEATASAAITHGLALLAGEAAPAALSYGEQIAELDRQRDGLRAATWQQREVVDGIADELTFEYATKLTPAWNQLQIEFYRAAQELARVTERIQDFRGRITAAGIKSRSDILLTPNVRAPLMLGREGDYNSEISGWRRILEKLL